MVVMSDNPAPFAKRDTATGKFIHKADTANLPFTGDIDIDADIQRLVTERDELRAENEGLKAHAALDATAVTHLIAESVELRAENEDVTRLCQSYLTELSEERVRGAKAEAEVERLRMEFHREHTEHALTYREIEAENERLRVVLVWAESELAYWDGRNADRYWQMNRVVMQLHSAFLVTE
jgi:hypothetical protein